GVADTASDGAPDRLVVRPRFIGRISEGQPFGDRAENVAGLDIFVPSRSCGLTLGLEAGFPVPPAGWARGSGIACEDGKHAHFRTQSSRVRDRRAEREHRVVEVWRDDDDVSLEHMIVASAWHRHGYHA